MDGQRIAKNRWETKNGEHLRTYQRNWDPTQFAKSHEVEPTKAGTSTPGLEAAVPVLENNQLFQLTYSYGHEIQQQTATTQPTIRTLEPSRIESTVKAILVEKLPESHGPGDNAIKQRTISIFGRQEIGKSNAARYIVEEALFQYGQDEVNVQVAKGEHFRELLEPDCWTKQPIQILVLEDITHCRLAEGDLRDFFRIREVMQRNSQRRDGLCIVFLTCHTFFQTPKSFRTNCDGLIALSAPWEEYDKNYLSRRIGRENLEFLEQAELREGEDEEQRAGVLIYRNMKPVRIEIPRIKPEDSFMYRMEQHWKHESARIQAEPQVTYQLNPNGESAKRYGLGLPRMAGSEKLETSTPNRRIFTLRPSLEVPKHEVWKTVAFLVFFATLVFAFAPRPLGLVPLLLVPLTYATSTVLALREISRWMKTKLEK
jgi:hypothetical protein